MSSCIYYNLYAAASVTAQGQSVISAAAMMFERFLANNVLFRSLNEIITFIDNVITEKREFDDSLYIEDIELVTSFEHIILTCGHGYIPSQEDMQIIWDIMTRLTQTDINRLFYKNNLYAFVNLPHISNAVTTMLKMLNSPYVDPNEVPEEIEAELEGFWELVREYVFYNHGIIDAVERLKYLPRKATLIIDTDSNIINLDPWYKFILDKVKDEDMEIKTHYITPVRFKKKDEFGDFELVDAVRFVDPPLDYDFYTDEVIEMERSINPVEIISQDGLRYSIINILAYCLGNMINEGMTDFSKRGYSYSPDKPCLYIMKNEYLFKRVLLTDVKKNYASIMELQEGNIVPDEESMDIKGLSLNKSTLNESAQDKLQKILEEDILRSKEINQLTVLKKIILLEKEIIKSLKDGKREYYRPVTIKSINAYDDPMRISGIKAALFWNLLKDEELPAFDLEQRNGLDIVKVDINIKNIENIKNVYPNVYSRLVKVFQMDMFRGKSDSGVAKKAQITALAIPSDINIPEWIMEFIDYKTIVHDNLTNFEKPLGSIGIQMANKVNYTNILKI